MILELDDNVSGKVQYDVCLSQISNVGYFQKASYLRTLNGETTSFNRGSTYDKWNSSFVIQDLEATLFALAEKFELNLRQVTLTLDDAEYVFGPGIDYTNPIVCNVTSNTIKHPQLNNALADLYLTVNAIHSNNAQLSFKASLPSTLPTKLAYQEPLAREIRRYDSPFNAAAFGDFGQNTPTDSSDNPVNNNVIDIVMNQNDNDSGQIAKFVSVQRSTPFIWPDASAPNFFTGQDTIPVMITGFSQKRLDYNLWENKLSIVSNAV